MNETDIAEARQRLHILRGFEVAMSRRDEVFETVEAAADADEARTKLSERFDLSEHQAQAVLSLQISQWSTGMREWRTAEIARCEELLKGADPA
ncbi:hypothetical protein KIH74_06505 [Kineosporia sp. J2-2]|uniref:Topo IIA-type catalytic domain-containing protein n=1 Tax=Kineosporia corallincola TaxID=2835133 RepID=A0ABS5TDS5_9ACTN|nr:DNA gyrase subunit A [Kineosporia corallincola]MBT0768569.1 hypothetical protein [Kineosporia corallincola]